MSDGFYNRVGTAPKPPRHQNELSATPQPDMPAQGGGHLLPSGTFKRWGAQGDLFFGMAETYDKLPCGLYRGGMTQTGPILLKQKVETDNLLELPDDAGASIIAEFDQFWKIGGKFRERGFLMKRGCLMWGPAGSGKTSCIHILVKHLIEDHEGVVLLIDQPQIAAACLQMLRKIEPHRPLIAIMEDLDALVNRYGENEFLALLDGEAQVDNVIFLASTNYPEHLDRRFVDRPSRFDTIRRIGMPSAAARKVYLSTKEPSLAAEELDEWVRLSDGFSVAHLKEMIIAVRCFGQPLSEVVERLEEMQARQPTSEDNPDRKGGAGFLASARNGHLQQ